MTKRNTINDNFGGLSKSFAQYDKSKIVILPVPFDKTSSWQRGAAKGPRAIIEASQFMELYDIETGTEVYKQGIFTAKSIRASSPLTLVDSVYDKVKKYLRDDKFVVTLGGEHTVSIGAIKAYNNVFDKMSILHLDAHADFRDTYGGNKYSHACVMSRVSEITSRYISVGIRSFDSSELKNIDANKTYFADIINKSDKWIDNVVRKLTDNVYITIDLDVFDPGIMPSTGTPEPGGLGWYSVIELLKTVSIKKNIIGFDVVELCPNKNKAPDYLATKLIYKLLNYSLIKIGLFANGQNYIV